jgi:hypothetical protein
MVCWPLGVSLRASWRVEALVDLGLGVSEVEVADALALEGPQ